MINPPRYRAIVSFLLLIHFGCGQPQDGTVTLRFLDAEDKSGAWAEIIMNFETRNPAIKVKLVEGPASTDTRENQYSASLLARDSTYDLIYLDVVWVPKFAAAGWLVPLDDRFPPEMRREFLPGDIEASTYAGNIWRIPIRTDGGMLYYRKDLLESANEQPPETFDDLVRISKLIQSPPELWGFVFQGKQYEGLTCVFLEVLRGFGGDVLGPEGGCILDSAETIAALEWMRSIMFDDTIAPQAVRTYEENEALAAFLSGKSVFMRNWPYAWKMTQGEGSPLEGKVGIVPMVHAPGEISSATLGGWGFGISTYSQHKDEAWAFAKHAASAESMKIFARRQGGAPSRPALFDDPELVALNPHYPQLYEVLIRTDPRPVHPGYSEISDSLQRHVSAVLTGMETPEQAVAAATKEIEPILARSAQTRN